MNKKKIAAIITEYRPRSHADVIVSKFLKGFPTDEGLCAPRVEIASMYIDQFPESDMGRAMAQEHGVPIFHSIPAALCLGGTGASCGWGACPLASTGITPGTRRNSSSIRVATLWSKSAG